MPSLPTRIASLARSASTRSVSSTVSDAEQMPPPPVPSHSSTPDAQLADDQKASPEESLKAYQLLEALRKGDASQITPLLDEVSAAAKHPAVNEFGEQRRTSTPLHLAVRCAKYPTVELVFRHQPSAVNSQDSRGQTPLHLASSLDRRDVLSFFLAQEDTNDMVRDQTGKTGLEVAASPEAATQISVSRSKWNEMYLAHLAAYIASPASDSASSSKRTSLTMDSPRMSTSSLAPPPPNSSSTSPVSAASGHVSNAAAEKLYHFITKPRSRCCDFSIRDSASGTTILHEAARRKDLGLIKPVLSKGGDVLARDKRGKLAIDLAKDQRIKDVLRQAANSEGRALQAASTPGVSAPGSNAGGAPTLGQAPVMKGYLQKWTNVAKGYKPRWFVLDNGHLSYYRSQEDEGKASRGSINMSIAKIDPPGTDKLKFTVGSRLGKTSPALYLKGNHPVEVMRWVDALRQNIELARGDNGLQRTPTSASTAPSLAPSFTTETRRPSTTALIGSSPAQSFGAASIDEDNETVNDEDSPPHAEDFHLMAQGAKTQLETTQRLLASLVDGGDASSQEDIKDALQRSLKTLDQLLDDYVDTVGQRERFFARRYEKELDAKRMWEESLREVATQHAAIEVELQKTAKQNTARKRALQEVRANLGAITPAMSPRNSVSVQDGERPVINALPEDGTPALPSPLRSPTLTIDTKSRSRGTTITSLSPSRARTRAGTAVQPLAPAELEQIVHNALHNEEGGETSEEEDEDEFFEAVETGAIPVEDEIHAESGADRQSKMSAPAQELISNTDLTPYKGYEHRRTSLPIKNDNRPSVSLWAILKGSIGKDLTKISFPVYFNEPTSMLQRMAEDMEFSECLDAAAAEHDSSKRIAYVAAFAMSNYSSTSGRIAKPFNPLLAETFEYVELDKKYRYVSEQVSHHPPISACIGQSPSWEYYGMVNAQSKFLGRSFEIRPTGTAHVTLRLPADRAPPGCPPCKTMPNMVEEHYSWLKVTTEISGFLTGSINIAHYGDMVVTNHRTGETCTLTFKPRGWRNSNAREIKGEVVDAQGNRKWEIAGKWDSQLVARRAGVGSGELAPDASLPTDHAGEVAPEYIRLWKNSPKPPNMPFNLTPYAITLNDLNDELKPWIPPTDCRLRPDQHAFEAGNFERANELKTELEEYQRDTRRKRERGELPPHKPRWFSRSTDQDTGELIWQPARTSEGQLEYWEERQRVGRAKVEGQKEEWREVDHIFHVEV
ncbi:hypothetical protein NBRC10513_006078 [Rhodotorula toruloides]|uniref:BY PROTMAP: gi/647398251/emb/CDR41975.1/ RHTO0S06e08416g2_1 [Rhodosporidium toruloides] n=1 Tax=Rhodotorula toruloides TaxID=5286 RepID=A0A0K3CCC4_RHOTO|nr:Oxysterol-binding protein-domain containing protein [Rhodotorula toruloides]